MITEQFIQNQLMLVDCAAYCDTSDGDWVNELNFPELKDVAKP